MQAYETSMDITTLLPTAFDLADLINISQEVRQYLEAKKRVEQDAAIQALIKKFGKAKEKFADCERFGHFHPDYHAALDIVKQVESELDELVLVQQFKQAEATLDQLLYDVSKLIAEAVSPSIKVPSNQVLPDVGCGSGGSCSGNCG
jgi:cell fate (sporulation/competence/biofilm development) regulator YlbF (YheA/YmcA/DUF963 family)